MNPYIKTVVLIFLSTSTADARSRLSQGNDRKLSLEAFGGRSGGVEPTLVIQGNDSSQTESDEDETNKITLIFGGGSGQIYGTTGGGDSDSDSETPQTSVDDKEKMYKPDLFGGDVPDNVGDVGDRGPDTSGDGDTTTTGNPPEESEENSQPTSGSTLKAGPAVAIAVGGALLLGMAIYFGQRRLKKGSEGKPDDNTADAPNSNPDIETAAAEA